MRFPSPLHLHTSWHHHAYTTSPRATNSTAPSGNRTKCHYSELTLEFLCGEKATITTVSASRQSSGPSAWGSYGHDGQTAVFSGLSLTYDSTGIRTGLEGLGIGEDTDGYTTITFLEAHRDGETLFLLWRVENMVYPFTTALHRLSAYEHTDE